MTDLPFDPMAPTIRILGEIDRDRTVDFLAAFATALQNDGMILVEVTTTGGDAEFGRRIALELKLARTLAERELYFLGKTSVQSAGATIMAAFPRERRYLTDDALVMIHCRRVEPEQDPGGPLRQAVKNAEAKVAQFRVGLDIEHASFADLIAGSDVSQDEINERAQTNWFLRAGQALERRLIAGIV